MRLPNVLSGLRQVTPQHLQICMAHQPLKRVHIHPISKTFERKRPPEVVQTWHPQSGSVCPPPYDLTQAPMQPAGL